MVAAPFCFGFLRDYTTLSASLVAYSVSTIICYLMSFKSTQNFDFSVIAERAGDFDTGEQPVALPSADSRNTTTTVQERE